MSENLAGQPSSRKKQGKSILEAFFKLLIYLSKIFFNCVRKNATQAILAISYFHRNLGAVWLCRLTFHTFKWSSTCLSRKFVVTLWYDLARRYITALQYVKWDCSMFQHQITLGEKLQWLQMMDNQITDFIRAY